MKRTLTLLTALPLAPLARNVAVTNRTPSPALSARK
jgi:hypothetical protein